MTNLKITKTLLLFVTASCLVVSCNLGNNSAPTTDDTVAQSVAIAFAQASTTGNFKTAQNLLIADSTNIEDFSIFTQKFNTQPPIDKEGLKKASLQNWHSSTVILDSIYIYTYTNSYTKKENSIKLVKTPKNIWRVDFTYYFNGNLN